MALQNLDILYVKIDGKYIEQTLTTSLLEVVVDLSMHMPSMFTIRINDPKLEWANSAQFEFGKKITIEAQAKSDDGSAKTVKLIEGEITAMEPDFSAESGSTFLVRGYDKANKLHFGKHSRTFTNQSDSSIVKTIAQECGLTPKVDATTTKFEHVVQYNQTNMEFLLERANRIGFQLFANQDNLYFQRGNKRIAQTPATLDLGKNLFSFQLSVSAAHQASEVKVLGWDTKAKKIIVGQSKPEESAWTQGTSKTPNSQTARKKLSINGKTILMNQPVADVDDAKAIAKGLADELVRQSVEAEGECDGDPRIQAGGKVTINGLGERYNGDYFVTSALHIYNEEGYRTRFSVSGRQPNSLSHLLEGKKQQSQRIDSVVVGIVTNLQDKLGLGRVKVKFPWMQDDAGTEIEGNWARIAAPMAGQGQKGFFFMPEIDDEVLVAFEHGDINCPYIVGVLWSNPDKPPKSNSVVAPNGKVEQRILRTRSGHEIVFNDSDNEPSIKLIDKTGKNSILIDSKNNVMSLNCAGKINIDAGADITVKTKGNFNVDATGNFAAKAKGNSSLESTGPLTLKSSANVSMSGTGNVEVKGAMISVNGSGMTEVKGATVSVSGSAIAELKAAIVKIN